MTVGAVRPLAIRGSGGCCCGLPAAAAHPATSRTWRYAGTLVRRAITRPAAFTVPSTRRPLLDHEALLGQAHDESGVVEVAPLPSLSQRGDGLEETTVESNRAATCTEWQPVEIDA